jgi:hypothetical protein
LKMVSSVQRPKRRVRKSFLSMTSAQMKPQKQRFVSGRAQSVGLGKVIGSLL